MAKDIVTKAPRKESGKTTTKSLTPTKASDMLDEIRSDLLALIDLGRDIYDGNIYTIRHCISAIVTNAMDEVVKIEEYLKFGTPGQNDVFWIGMRLENIENLMTQCVVGEEHFTELQRCALSDAVESMAMRAAKHFDAAQIAFGRPYQIIDDQERYPVESKARKAKVEVQHG